MTLKPGEHWANNFTTNPTDHDYLINLLLETEKPMTIQELALALIEKRLSDEAEALKARYQDVQVYSPAKAFQPGQKLVFPAIAFATGVVVDTRPGFNPEHADFTVIAVQFDEVSSGKREFAAELKTAHKLSEAAESDNILLSSVVETNPQEILQNNYDQIIEELEKLLHESGSLVRLAGQWFPQDLIMDVNVGHLNLAEAVLDMVGGGPLPPQEILEQIGGIGSAPLELQIFSLNYALNEDSRFDEVGPTGEVLWHLSRLKPAEVIQTPPMLRYEPIAYDRTLLTPEMLELEENIGDEFSPLTAQDPSIEVADLILSYPHRRMGTLGLNYQSALIFPTARKTKHVWVTLVDGQDDEEYVGWVVLNDRYVYGLGPFYRKHKLPIGAHISVRRGKAADQVIIDYTAHRPRTEWIRLIVPQNGQLHFENHKRTIGADYDELMILGVDDLQAVDALHQSREQERKNLPGLLRALIAQLSHLTPQGTVHTKTLYSALNVLRRCPPGPMMAALLVNPEFEDVGGHYWRLRV